MVGIIKQNLKEYNPEAYDIFCKKMEDASGVTTQKEILYVRVWICKCKRCIIR